jgi:hypothetical protein
MAVLGIALMSLTGCGNNLGTLTTQSTTLGDVEITSRYQTGYYTLQENGLVMIVLVDGPVDNPTQVTTIRTIWTPSAGRTPIEPDATNATIHYIIYAGPDKKIAGVYSGAGYVYLHDRSGKPNMEFSLWQSNLILIDSTPGFNDLLGQSNMHGSFEVPRNDIKALSLLKNMREHISARLGYPRQVLAPAPSNIPVKSSPAKSATL